MAREQTIVFIYEVYSSSLYSLRYVLLSLLRHIQYRRADELRQNRNTERWTTKKKRNQRIEIIRFSQGGLFLCNRWDLFFIIIDLPSSAVHMQRWGPSIRLCEYTSLFFRVHTIRFSAFSDDGEDDITSPLRPKWESESNGNCWVLLKIEKYTLMKSTEKYRKNRGSGRSLLLFLLFPRLVSTYFSSI